MDSARPTFQYAPFRSDRSGICSRNISELAVRVAVNRRYRYHDLTGRVSCTQPVIEVHGRVPEAAQIISAGCRQTAHLDRFRFGGRSALCEKAVHSRTEMELAKLVLEFVKALAWPITALVSSDRSHFSSGDKGHHCEDT